LGGLQLSLVDFPTRGRPGLKWVFAESGKRISWAYLKNSRLDYRKPTASSPTRSGALSHVLHGWAWKPWRNWRQRSFQPILGSEQLSRSWKRSKNHTKPRAPKDRMC